MIKKIKTNEGIQYKKLSPEEMKAKGILGRLIGPCADFNNATRNGRKYSEQLWENVFNDPIMQEKIKNGVCFGELGHPEDRTEIDMEKIAVCLREQPVKNDKGQLCAVFDILDTPNGRILKTLCDYGSTVGVSSRGQGDLITDANGDEAVDPDTYECECWDIVLVPAVESARMQYVKEDLDTNKSKLRKALTESLNKASEEDKKIMKETLDELDIKLNDDKAPSNEGEAFLQEIENEMDPEEARAYYFEQYEFDKVKPEDEFEEKVCAALKKKGNIEENLTEAKEEGLESWKAYGEVKEIDTAELDENELKALKDLEKQAGIKVVATLISEDPELDNRYIGDDNVAYIGSWDRSVDGWRWSSVTLEDLAETNESLTEAKKDKEEEVEEPAPEEEAPKEAEPEEGEEKPEEGEEEPKVIDDVVAELDADENEAIDAYEKATAEIEAMEVLEKDAVLEIINHIKEEEQEHIKELEDALAVAKGEKTPEEVAAAEEEEVTIEAPADELAIENPEDADLEEGLKKECGGESCTDKKEEAKEVVEESTQAIDNGDAELLKSLQEALKGKSDLEGSLKSLQEKLAVSDTKVNELTEECNNHKKAIARLATMSKSNKDLKESVTKLEESLKEKDAVIAEQKTRIARLVKGRKESVSESASLTESVNAKTSEITTLNESLNKAQDEVKTLNEKLSTVKQDSDKEISELKEGLNKAESVKEAYKKLANKAVNKYIDIKANMLGLTSKDIKRKLGESYTLEDVDQVCEDLKSYQLNVSKLPFSIDRKVGVRVNESAPKAIKKSSVFDDDEVDESLIKLANI